MRFGSSGSVSRNQIRCVSPPNDDDDRDERIITRPEEDEKNVCCGTKEEEKRVCLSNQYLCVQCSYLLCIYADIICCSISQRTGLDLLDPAVGYTRYSLLNHNLCCGCAAFWSVEATVAGRVGLSASYLAVGPMLSRSSPFLSLRHCQSSDHLT